MKSSRENKVFTHDWAIALESEQIVRILPLLRRARGLTFPSVTHRAAVLLIQLAVSVAIAQEPVNPPPPEALPQPSPVRENDQPPELDLALPKPVDGALVTPEEPEMPLGVEDPANLSFPAEIVLTTFGNARIEGDLETGVVVTGRHKITGDNGLEIFADRSRMDLKAESVTAEGNVEVFQGNLLQRGERVVYFYKTRQLDSDEQRLSIDPLLLEAGKFETLEGANGRVLRGRNAGITTEDVADPSFWVRADETLVIPGDRVIFRNMRVFAGDQQVFWLPYLAQPLDAELGYHFVPGSRSNLGPYLLNQYGTLGGGAKDPATGEAVDPWLLTTLQLDLFSRRGAALGLGFSEADNENQNLTGFRAYGLHDFNPEITRTGIPRFDLDSLRYNLELKQRFPFEWQENVDWHLDANLNVLSDRHFLEDFDPSRFQVDPAPDNTLGLFRRDETSLFSLFTRFQLNDFYRADTRLPEISLDQARGPLFGNGSILHEGRASFSVLGIQTADQTRRDIVDPLRQLPANSPAALRLANQLQGYERQLATRYLALKRANPADPRADAILDQLSDTGFNRFNIYQELSVPLKIGSWLNLTPQVGVGYTSYSAVDGPTDGFDHPLLYFGTEASMRFSKDYGSVGTRAFGLDGILHVIQPYATWSIVDADGADENIPRVDRLTLSTRPRTLSPGRFTAIDDLESWNTVRFGARNRLITRRDGQSFEWFYLDSFIDGFVSDPEFDRNFSNLYNDATWSPLPWLGLRVETQFPIVSGGSGFNEFATSLRFAPNPDFEFQLGYRMLDNHPVLLDSNRVDLRAYHRIGEFWGVGMQQIWELADNTLELQQYTVHRDMGAWLAGIGLSQRDNRYKNEYGIVLSLTLKEFPSLSLPFRIDAQ